MKEVIVLLGAEISLQEHFAELEERQEGKGEEFMERFILPLVNSLGFRRVVHTSTVHFVAC